MLNFYLTKKTENCSIVYRNDTETERGDTMGPRFDETQRGRKFYDSQLPKLIKAIEENTAELKRANDIKEKELASKGADTYEKVRTGADLLQDGRN